MKRVKKDHSVRNQRLGLAAITVFGISLITAILMTPSDRDRVKPAIMFLSSEAAHDPLNLIGHGDTFAIRLPEPILEVGHRSAKVYAFNCNRTIAHATAAEREAMSGFYAACAEAREIASAPADPHRLGAAAALIHDMKRDSEGRVMFSDGTRICDLEDGRPVPYTGQTLPDFLRHKAACTAYAQSENA